MPVWLYTIYMTVRYSNERWVPNNIEPTDPLHAENNLQIKTIINK